MRPDKHTVGNIGDIMTDEVTGKQYKLVNIYHVDVDGDTNDEKTYEWDEIPEENGGISEDDLKALLTWDNLSGKPDIPEPGVSSWNDLTDKPFYEEVTLTEVFTASVSITEDDYGMLVIPVEESVYNLFEQDNALYVKWDDVTYKPNYGSNGCGVGNESLYDESFAGDDVSNDTGEPFFIGLSMKTGKYLDVYTPELGDHTFTVYTSSAVVKPLDEKYIPESIARVSDIDALVEAKLRELGVIS